MRHSMTAARTRAHCAMTPAHSTTAKSSYPRARVQRAYPLLQAGERLVAPGALDVQLHHTRSPSSSPASPLDLSQVGLATVLRDFLLAKSGALTRYACLRALDSRG